MRLGASGLQFVKTPGETTLATRSGVLVNRSRTGDLIQDRTHLAEFGFRGVGILQLNSIKEGFHLSLHSTLAPIVERTAFEVLTDSLLGRFCIRHGGGSQSLVRTGHYCCPEHDCKPNGRQPPLRRYDQGGNHHAWFLHLGHGRNSRPPR